MTVRFLIIRFSSIGDIVLTTPVIRCLKQQVENAEIHFLTKEAYKSVLEHNPYIDKLHVLEKDSNSVIRNLKQEKIDYVIDLHRNLRSARVKFALKKMSFSFNKLNFKKWLLVNFKINQLPKLHIVDRYMQTLKLFDVTNDNAGLDYFIAPEDENTVNQLPASFWEGYAAVVVGAKHTTKRLPVEKLKELCSKLSESLVLMGGKEDYEIAEQIKTVNPKKIFNACGLFSLNQSADIIKYATVVITHDTGLMHIAAAFNKRIVSIWGNTIPEFGMYPYQTKNRFYISEVKDLKCRPCSKIGFKECPKKHFNCMNLQSVDKLAETVNDFYYN